MMAITGMRLCQINVVGIEIIAVKSISLFVNLFGSKNVNISVTVIARNAKIRLMTAVAGLINVVTAVGRSMNNVARKGIKFSQSSANGSVLFPFPGLDVNCLRY